MRTLDSSPLPPPEPRLGRGFYVLLIAPLLVLGGSLLIAKGPTAVGSVMIYWISVLFMLISSVVCAIMIARCYGAAVGFWAMLGILAVYIAAAFSGCVVVANSVGI
jgi:hypothetical protein